MSIDISEIMDCVVNPVKSKIILAIREMGQCTAKELLNNNGDIPQATLYRTLKRLVETGIIIVVAENKVRAVMEKVYAVNEDFNPNSSAVIMENDGEAYFKLFSNFVMELIKEFKNYAELPSINIAEDGSGFSASPIYATVEELKEIGVKLGEIVIPYQKKNPLKHKEQKIHTLATIVTPPKE